MKLRLNFYGLSDIGLSRPNNEDVWVALEEIGFFALADGMGGHQAGEVAAKEAIDSLTESVRSLKAHDCLGIIAELRDAIEKANQYVLEMGQGSETYLGMGTTLCCLLWTEEMVVYAHVGDSRVYRFRKKKLELLTEDHSLFAKWLREGKLAEECETPYPYKNVITRAVGTGERANPEIAIAVHQEEDLYFLCSDGLSDVLSLQEMEEILNTSFNLKIASERLIERAKIKGSSDNMTILMVKHGEDFFRQQCDDGSRAEGVQGDAGRSQRTAGKPL